MTYSGEMMIEESISVTYDSEFKLNLILVSSCFCQLLMFRILTFINKIIRKFSES
jgi:hypothetical protein